MNGDNKTAEKPVAAAPAGETQVEQKAGSPNDVALAAVHDRVMARIMGDPMPEEKKETKPDEGKETPEPGKETPAPEAKTEVEAAKPAETPAAPAAETPPKRVTRRAPKAAAAPSPEQIAAAAAKGAAEAIIAANKPAPAAEPEKPKLNPIFARDEEHYRYLAENDPAHKNLIEDLNAFADRFKEYKAQWIAQNPGQKFDKDSEEVQAWMDENEPKVSDRDFAKASGAIEARKAAEPLRKEREQEQRQKEVERIVDGAVNGAKASFASGAQALILAATGATEFKPELVEQLAADPVTELVVETTLNVWKPRLEAAGAILSPEGHRIFDKNNPDHVRVAKVVMTIEDELGRLDDTEDDSGRTFVSREQYAKMTPEQRELHYTVTSDMVQTVLNRTLQNDLKTRLDRVKKPGGAAASTAKSGSENVQKTAPKETRVEAAAPAATTTTAATSGRAASVGTGAPTIAAGAGAKQGDDDIYQKIINRMVGV